MSPSLSPEVFVLLATLVEERFGMHHAPEDRPLFEGKVLPRVLAQGFDSFLDYYYFLRYDPQAERELLALGEALVVHETFLFRELPTLDAVVQACARVEGRLRIWCAACATGEEPYTLAMLLDEAGIAERVTLVATDLSRSAIERARAGRLGPRSLRGEPTARLARLLARWTEDDDAGRRVLPALTERVRFDAVNLLDEASVHALGRFDHVICRNVLIYLAAPTLRRVAATLRGRLRPGGRLWVGVSESLVRHDVELVCVEQDGAFAYVPRDA